MSNLMTASTARIRVYSPHGFQLFVELAYDTPDALMSEVNRIASAGFHPSPPTLDPGAEKEAIVTVMRRAKGDGTPIIDFYPAWNSAGTFGAHKYAHMYLDSDEEIAQFEKVSGLTLNNIPLYEAQSPLRRTHGQTHRCETPVVNSFEIQKIPDGEYPDGKNKYRYDYVNASVVTTTTDTPATTGQSDSSQEKHWCYINGQGDKAVETITSHALNWDNVKKQIEPGRTLARISDTSLSYAEFMARLDALAFDDMGGGQVSTDNPLMQTSPIQTPNQYDQEEAA